MKKSTIQKLRNGLVSGSGENRVSVTQDGDEYNYNLSGAVSLLEQVADEMEQYNQKQGELSQEQLDKLDRGQRAIQKLLPKVGDVLNDIESEGDGTLDLPNGKTVDLPNKASQNAKQVNVPNKGGGN